MPGLWGLRVYGLLGLGFKGFMLYGVLGLQGLWLKGFRFWGFGAAQSP